MNIKLVLDTKAISRLIDDLEFFKEHIGEELVNVLCIEGADEANIAYGSMAHADGGVVEATEGSVIGKIIATSGSEDTLLIAEFGAGDATISPSMEFEGSELNAVVFPGAYSLLKGSKEYYEHGSWQFPPKSGIYHTEVEARHGMFNAKLYVMQNYERLAEELIRFD